jgi:hypothetical protein
MPKKKKKPKTKNNPKKIINEELFEDSIVEFF